MSDTPIQPSVSVAPISTVLPFRQPGRGGPLNEHGLSAKEELFAQSVGGGSTKSDAYRKAYTTSGLNATGIWHGGYTVARRPAVAARIAQLTGERNVSDAAALLHDSARAKSYIVERLWIESSDSTNKPAERLKALELLGKLEHVAAFRERTETVTIDARSPVEIQARIAELLKQAG